MKGEDKMKQTIMGIGLIVGVLAGFVPSVDAQTQKKPVDIEACMSWKRDSLFFLCEGDGQGIPEYGILSGDRRGCDL